MPIGCRSLARALGVVIGLGVVGEAAAGALHGELLGVFEGNDSEDSILLDLGLEAIQLDRVESRDDRAGGLEISILATKDGGEPIAGAWSYAVPIAVDLIVVKAGNAYAAYRYDGATRHATSHAGRWATSELGNRELSHLTAYRVAPEPSTAALLVAGLAVFCLVRRGCAGRSSEPPRAA